MMRTHLSSLMVFVDEGTVIPDDCKIGPFTLIGKNVKIGRNVIFGAYNEIRDDCIIGDNTSFGSRVTLAAGTIIGVDCRIKYGFVATDENNFDGVKRPSIIMNEVKIGANVTLMPNKRIGNRVTIGAGCVVTKNVESNTTVYAKGVAAKNND